MRYFLIDEITDSDLKRIKVILKQDAMSSGLEQVFWVEVPDSHLSREQAEQDDHKPYLFAVECGKDWIKAELFIRTLGDFKGVHQGYCTASQREYKVEYIEGMIKELEIGT